MAGTLFPDIPSEPICRFSADRRYRYTLWRRWRSGDRFVQFIGLNPSTADETEDDPTIRRLIGFAKQLDFPALCMTNLFAFRATDPREMRAAPDPTGLENDNWLVRIAAEAELIVCCWGAGGKFMQRGISVASRLGREQCVLKCFGRTKSGDPRHPLYLPKSAELLSYYP